MTIIGKKYMETKPTTLEDVSFLAPRLQEEQVLEIKDGTGLEPLEGLMTAFLGSEEAQTFLYRGEPCGICGITYQDPRQPKAPRFLWFMSGDNLRKSIVAMTRTAPAWLEYVAEKYTPNFGDFVDARYDKSIRWLQTLGFTIRATDKEFGPAKVPFHWMAKGKG